MQKLVVYQATVTEASGQKQTYVGLTEGDFKTRWNAHNSSFNNVKYQQATELSKHVWGLKKSKTDINTSWQILDSASAYTNLTKRSNLCLLEKFDILSYYWKIDKKIRIELMVCIVFNMIFKNAPQTHLDPNPILP